MQVVLIGAGNLATIISTSIIGAGHNILQIFSKSENSAKLLANKTKSGFTSTLRNIIPTADLYLIAIPDKTIPHIVIELPKLNGIVVHCSGGSSIDILQGVNAKGYGVFYPFQTFTKTRPLGLKDVPLLIEANNDESFKIINHFACSLSEKVITIDSDTRAWIHLSGVFANNYINHLITISNKILAEKNIDTNIINPLITETISKALSIGSLNAQTGPAIRFDDSTMVKHIKMLKVISPELAKIYKELSLSIQSTSKLKS